ncbi:MAG: DUF6468 domain-containing protein [Phenylobacterium sp.]
MSIISLGLNFLLAGLMAAALAMGWRLNQRLKALRDSHDGFALAVRELNTAAGRAEQGLADLRAATDEATDALADRIEKGRALATRLERLIGQAPGASFRDQAEPEDTRGLERRLDAVIAAAREGRAERPARREAQQAEAQPQSRLRARPRLTPQPAEEPTDADDIFADLPPLSLSAVSGGRR